jgi:hypothetical protein
MTTKVDLKPELLAGHDVRPSLDRYRRPGGISPSGLGMLFDHEERQKQAGPATWPIDSWSSSGAPRQGSD